jgi:hypothetical protein
MSSTAAVMTCFKKLKDMFTIREYVGSFQVFGGFLKLIVAFFFFCVVFSVLLVFVLVHVPNVACVSMCIAPSGFFNVYLQLKYR